MRGSACGPLRYSMYDKDHRGVHKNVKTVCLLPLTSCHSCPLIYARVLPNIESTYFVFIRKSPCGGSWDDYQRASTSEWRVSWAYYIEQLLLITPYIMFGLCSGQASGNNYSVTNAFEIEVYTIESDIPLSPLIIRNEHLPRRRRLYLYTCMLC